MPQNKKPADFLRRARDLMIALYLTSYRPPPTRSPCDDGDGDVRRRSLAIMLANRPWICQPEKSSQQERPCLLCIPADPPPGKNKVDSGNQFMGRVTEIKSAPGISGEWKHISRIGRPGSSGSRCGRFYACPPPEAMADQRQIHFFLSYLTHVPLQPSARSKRRTPAAQAIAALLF